MTDVVYTLGTGSVWDDMEVVYSLRSFEQHFRDLGRVWIVGYLPPRLRNVIHLSLPDPYKANKDGNMINKVLRVCAEPELSERFILCSDDQCLLAEASTQDFGPCLVEDLREIRNWGTDRWAQRLHHTFERLTLARHTTYNLESHTPLLTSKDLFPKIMLRFDFGADVGYNIVSLYYNALGTRGRPRDADAVRYGAFGSGTSTSIDEGSKGKLFLAYNDEGLDDGLKSFLARRFPTPSRFENPPD